MKNNSKKNNSDNKLSRRNFISTAGMAAAAFTIVPRNVLGGAGYTAPSDMLNIAGIGIGGRGKDDLHAICDPDIMPALRPGQPPRTPIKLANIYALCDVDSKFAAPVFASYPKAKVYSDYRIMLEKEKSIDAVVIATPDHNHAIISMAALRAGKHVYCEKPLTHTIYEARALTKAAKASKLATQMGNQGMAVDANRQLKEWLWDGAIGEVREVHAWSNRPIWPQGVERPKDTPPVPDTLNWDLWLGPAPYRPYHPAYVPFAWRGWFDFGSGPMGDEAIHNLAPVFSSLKLHAPTSVSGSSSPVFPETFPLASTLHYEFPARDGMPPVTVHWYDGGLLPERPKELDKEKELPKDNGAIFVGSKGKILSAGEGTRSITLLPESRNNDYKRPAPTLPRSIGHQKEWIEACKGNGTTESNFGFAGPLTEACQLGNICIRSKGKVLEWDSENLKITNNDEANKLIHFNYREGWTL
ncbi:MAG TPA: oxidoreductase [Sphingobacteriaceae bacterium]|nr:oxidoreductase [Sphingobacteriaceae bacterium]